MALANIDDLNQTYNLNIWRPQNKLNFKLINHILASILVPTCHSQCTELTRMSPSYKLSTITHYPIAEREQEANPKIEQSKKEQNLTRPSQRGAWGPIPARSHSKSPEACSQQ